jgi:hypothetical protein
VHERDHHRRHGEQFSRQVDLLDQGVIVGDRSRCVAEGLVEEVHHHDAGKKIDRVVVDIAIHLEEDADHEIEDSELDGGLHVRPTHAQQGAVIALPELFVHEEPQQVATMEDVHQAASGAWCSEGHVLLSHATALQIHR